jgi:hypothetical protein
VNHQGIFSIIVASAVLLVAGHAAAFETINPTDANLLYTGRFNTTTPSLPTFDWSGTSIMANFEGTSLRARFANDTGWNSYGNDYLQVIIDDGNPFKVDLNTNATTYTLATGLTPGVHKVEIVKESQGYTGRVTFQNLQLDNGSSLVAPPSRPPIKLEFYGDSNTAGNSALSQCDCGGGVNESNYYNYVGITSRMINAEYHSISQGGLRASNVDEIWDLQNWTDYNPTWDFNKYTPDAVIINLGANDTYADSSPSGQAAIANDWKDFINNKIRFVHPNAHVVLANSYGWYFNEPTDYVDQVVQDLHNAGDTNVSYVKFPWLWSQQHAVVSEQAGFANILAPHLADKLGLPAPTLNTLTSFGAPGAVGNGSLENSFTDGEVDGWRPFGNGTDYLESVGDAHHGTDYVRVTNSGGFYHPNDATEGEQFVLTGWMRGDPGDEGRLRLEFKDQGQNILGSTAGIHTVTDDWQQFTTLGTAPAGTWQVTVVLTTTNGNVIEFDDIQLSYATDGDFNGDLIVDGADFLKWQREDGSPASLLEWETNYGNDYALAAASAAVPEPSTLLLASLAGLLFCSRQR